MSTTHSSKNQSTQLDTSLSAILQEQFPVNVGQTERLVSALGGAGLAAYGLVRRDWAGVLLAALGTGLVYRGASGRCLIYKSLNKSTATPKDTVEQISTNVSTIPGKNGIKVRRSITVNRTPAELYNYWKLVEKAPLYTPHVESVMKTGERTSHWLAPGPFGKTIEWNSELLQDEPNSLISWHVHGKSPAANSGQVSFEEATGGRGTVVTLELNYYGRSPLATTLGKLGKQIPEFEAQQTLHQFKDLMEAGEVPTTKGQPTGKDKQ